eukprot:c26916_g1_i1 orf=403-1587(+)
MGGQARSTGVAEDWWTSETGGWATWVVMGLLLGWYIMRIVIHSIKEWRGSDGGSIQGTWWKLCRTQAPLSSTNLTPSCEKPSAITEADLQRLVEELVECSKDETPWEHVLDRRNERVAYSAKRRDPKDGNPTQYLSTTVFENCSTEQLIHFYMDNDYRVLWDTTVVKHEQLEICKQTGIEVGRTIKKFPLLTPREYVLAWRVWKGKDGTYYCFIKECDHAMAPRRPTYKRIELYRSGWQLHKVPGKNACEIKMWHQEDVGMQRGMAKMAFSQKIWSYVCKMDIHLRKYISMGCQLGPESNAVALAQQVPVQLYEVFKENIDNDVEEHNLNRSASRSLLEVKFSLHQSGKWLAKGLLLLGGAVFCTRGTAALGAKLASVFLVKKMIKPRPSVHLS